MMVWIEASMPAVPSLPVWAAMLIIFKGERLDFNS
jgi:hypothetical protein